MSFQPIPLADFHEVFSSATELSGVALGGKIVAVSDEFFAEAFHLLLTEPAPSLKGKFGPNGALFSGWESRRHNPAHDWCIVQLASPGYIMGFDVDTAHFNGNEAPQVSIEVLSAPISQPPKENDPRWLEVLPKVDMGPNSRHLFKIPVPECVNYVKLNMYPDGGIARFRVYGHVSPVFPAGLSESFDLAHAFAGGRVVFTSDQHFGVGSNLILPGRGKDMGDGWETKRSRAKGHKDWAIIRLGTPGFLEYVEIDTAHFKGNFPESCEIHATSTDTEVDWKASENDQSWTLVLPRTKLGPHRQHYFQLENVDAVSYTHIRVTIYPDGGIKRVRVIGRRSDNVVPHLAETPNNPESTTIMLPLESSLSATDPSKMTTIPVLPLTPEAFSPFGQVIQAYADHTAAPKGTRITPANGGSAAKFHKLSLFESSYPLGAKATSGLSVYRCQPTKVAQDGTTELTVLERHSFTNQAFIPMGAGSGEGLRDSGTRYLVVVAQNSSEDRPDVQTVRAFMATAAQGIVYNKGIWHQPMTVLDKPMDFACAETQIGDGGVQDCEIVELRDIGSNTFKLKI